MAVDARALTWDVLSFGEFGLDIAFLDAALAKLFSHVRADPGRIALGGFSDGASYALSVGLSNGDLFDHVIAWSPGFMAPTRRQGQPRVYISHGSFDQILSADNTFGNIAQPLVAAGYEVRYKEFQGGHEIPPEIAWEAFHWFMEL